MYLTACAHDPLAVGVYLAIARCVTAGRGPVPIPAADLAAWDGYDQQAGTVLISQQMQEHVIGAILGHAPGQNITRRYAHVTVETMRQVLTQLEADILRRAA